MSNAAATIAPTSRRIASAGLVSVVAIGLGVLLAGCTGRGGGWLPPQVGMFDAQATFGFTFRCEDRSSSPKQAGRLHIQLQYTEHGTNPTLGGPFSIHGQADVIDPVLESAVCIGENPPPGGNELIFLGTYRSTAASDPSFPANCRSTGPDLCRFEVVVQDNDGDLAPSAGDYFQITLSGYPAAGLTMGELSALPDSGIYHRAGYLAGGNIEVD
jgi:hypothetical protein